MLRLFTLACLVILCSSSIELSSQADNIYMHKEADSVNRPIWKDSEASRPYKDARKRSELSYIEDYCKKHTGRVQYPIHGGMKVDCATNRILWNVSFATQWPIALSEALAYGIYDTYAGDSDNAPSVGVVLIYEDQRDFREMVKLRQLVRYYKLPVELDSIQNYGVNKVDTPRKDDGTLRLRLYKP